MKPCRCWNEPIDGWNPTCLADHCCFTAPDECHDAEMRTYLGEML